MSVILIKLAYKKWNQLSIKLGKVIFSMISVYITLENFKLSLQLIIGLKSVTEHQIKVL